MLTELVVDTCIPNDTTMAADSGRVQVKQSQPAAAKAGQAAIVV